MMRRVGKLCVALAMTLQGCAIGYDTTLFMTKSNLGLDVDSKPPTAELSIARREGVLEPSFDGTTLPVVAGFTSASNPFSNYFLGVSSVFGGGDAAEIVTNLDDGPAAQSKRLCLAQQPKGRFLFWTFDSLAPQPNEVRPLVFGTDTTLGLKLAWSGMTAEFPDTIRVGFQRKEIAIAPVSGRDLAAGGSAETCTDQNGHTGTYEVWMPSFLAWMSVDINVGTPAKTGVGYAQGFATGEAANHWAALPSVKRLVLDRAAGTTVAAAFNAAPDAQPLRARINSWLKADPEHRPALRKWLIDGGKIADTPLAEVTWIFSAPQDQLQSAIDQLSIS